MRAYSLSHRPLTDIPPPAGDPGIDWRMPAFYVLVPLAFAAYGAMHDWQLVNSLGLFRAGVYYLGHAQLPWLATCALSSLAMRVLRPWKPRPAAILFIGHGTACIVVLPYLEWLTAFSAIR